MGLCRERCLHDGVCLTTVTGLQVRKREELAVKRPGELLFRQLSESALHSSGASASRITLSDGAVAVGFEELVEVVDLATEFGALVGVADVAAVFFEFQDFGFRQDVEAFADGTLA